MRHAFVYHGALEKNHATLAPGATTFVGTDGTQAEIAPWPESAYLRFGYMEKAGKKFCVVRAADAQGDVVVANELVLEPGRHMGYGVRLGPEPTLVEDDSVILTLLEDLIKKNADKADALMQMRDRLKRAIKR
ncbi:MAG: hypothetical protein KJZ74_03620 [Gemmatimonadales bacterium]|nr:hypothetical protein [Gemmatimonadota bacterium]MCL4212983.1 hypothetical protein [Gemmatimonadales bacterium]